MPTTPPIHEHEPSSLTLAEAAVLLSHGAGVAGTRLRRAVEAQLQRRGVLGSDRDDVRADVAFALLTATRGERLTLDAACAHVATVARHKAVDQHRRRRREAPDNTLPQLAVPSAEGRLAGDLDIVTAEAHRRDVSRALVDLVASLSPAERLALLATATGGGALVSGLGRSSHYRALGRARLRLTASVQRRIAGGLALPALLLRRAGAARGLLSPLGAALVAGIASMALVLPAIDLPTAAVPRRAAATLPSQRVVHATRPIAPPTAPAARVVQRRARLTVAAIARVRAHVAPVVHHRVAAVTRVPTTVSTPDAGLGPCRAARLCQ